MKAPSPLLGFNNNVRHKGRVFHIQTEDSGIRHPHIITHLFADGGRILKTTKTSYAEHVGNERLAETVRAMMQEQHKAMFIALRDGQFDHLFDEGAGPASTAMPNVGPKPKAEPAAPPTEPAPAAQRPPEPPPPRPIAAPPPPEPPAPPPASARTPPPSARIGGASALPSASPSTTPQAAPNAAPAEAARITRPASSRPAVTGAPARPAMAPTEPAMSVPLLDPPSPRLAPQAQPPAPPAAQAAPEPPAARRTAQGRPKLDVDPAAIHGVGSPAAEPSIDLDLDALERAAAEAQTPFIQQIQDLPPPPAAVLGSKRAAAGSYSVRSVPPPGMPATPPRIARNSPVPGQQPPPPNARYAPSRPASIFATTRPQEGASIFGEDLISEKSLDEVILGYLAEDLDGPAEKK